MDHPIIGTARAASPHVELVCDMLECGWQVNNIGLWLMTRAPVVGGADYQNLVSQAARLGFDTSVLAPVRQTGCSYVGAPSHSHSNSGAAASDTQRLSFHSRANACRVLSLRGVVA